MSVEIARRTKSSKGCGVIEIEVGVESGVNIFAFGARVELDGILGADLKERAQNLLSPWSQSTKGFEDNFF